MNIYLLGKDSNEIYQFSNNEFQAYMIQNIADSMMGYFRVFLMLLGIFFITKKFSVRENVTVDIMYHDNQFTAYIAKTACFSFQKGDTISIDIATHNQFSFCVLNETEEITHWCLSLEPIEKKTNNIKYI